MSIQSPRLVSALVRNPAVDRQPMVLLSNHSFSEDGLDATTAEPMAIVVLFGWWGAKSRHLEKYSDIYRDMSCVTLRVICDPMAVASGYQVFCDPCAREAIVRTAALVRKVGGNVPVFFHGFSNGVYIMSLVEKLMIEKRPQYIDDVLLVEKRLTGEIFDSAPAYFDLDRGLKAAHTAIPSRIIVLLLYWIAYFRVAVYNLLFRVFGIITPMDAYWNDMLNRLCLRQAYIYSKTDEITDYAKVDELVEYRRKRSDDIWAKRLEDGVHIQLLRSHPEEYRQFVTAFIKSAT